MNQEQALAFVQAQTVAASIHLASMLAANAEAVIKDYALPYDETSIYGLIPYYSLDHDSVIRTLRAE